MAYKSFLNLAFLSLFSLSLHLLHPASASRRGLFTANEGGARNGTDSPSPDGMCAIAVTKHGYKCQEYHVKTDDGYILSLQRIPEGRTGGGGGNRPPVLLQHGVLVDGMTWLMNSPGESLAMILADHGFDVWISNFRGTRFSRQHVTLDSNNPEFWNWTWDDLVIHDVPSAIQLVSAQTGQKIHYVGHSMGTLVALTSLSEGKFENVKSAALLSPIAYLSHMTSPLGVLAAKAFVGEVTETFGLAEFNPKGVAVDVFLKALCATANPTVDCYDLLTVLTGKNCCLNASTVENFMEHEPQPTATKNLVHFAQTVRDGGLSKFDYGVPLNLMHYGESQPPDYDLSKIPRDFPLFLSYGGQDALSDVKDVAKLLGYLKSHDQDKLEVQFIKDYAHVDFILGVNAKDILYNRIIDFFRKYN